MGADHHQIYNGRALVAVNTRLYCHSHTFTQFTRQRLKAKHIFYIFKKINPHYATQSRQPSASMYFPPLRSPLLSLFLRKGVVVRLPEFHRIGCSCLFLLWRLLFEPFFHGYANHIATLVWCTWCQHAPTVKTVFRIIAHGPHIEQRGNPTQHTRQDSQPMVPKHGHVPNHCFFAGVF